MRIFISGLAVIGLALGAQAQEAEVQPEWELQAYVTAEMCLRGEGPEADRAPDCRGIVYDSCPGNDRSTQEMAECSAAELRFWDGRFNETYRALMQAYRAGDAEDPDSPYKLEPLLQNAQRAWIAYRDAECLSLQRYRYRGGTMGRLTAGWCMVEMTAERAQELEELLDDVY